MNTVEAVFILVGADVVFNNGQLTSKHTIDIAVERCQDGMVDIMDML